MDKSVSFVALGSLAFAAVLLASTVASQASRSGNAQHCLWHRVQAQLASQKGDVRKAQFHWHNLRLCQAGKID